MYPTVSELSHGGRWASSRFAGCLSLPSRGRSCTSQTAYVLWPCSKGHSSGAVFRVLQLPYWIETPQAESLRLLPPRK